MGKIKPAEFWLELTALSAFLSSLRSSSKVSSRAGLLSRRCANWVLVSRTTTSTAAKTRMSNSSCSR